ncbi:MAG TPA: xanthine dehydrogenase family protein subunit M [Kofleriaceae bacterium]|jgi:carbon-monoxide dehydrogenase medium subunit|nr:xanthine dehydrogenase family protein subunit M [Kofleriaceae bacterium]
MIPASFDYHVPATLDEAIALLGKLGDSAKILAGGQSLIPAMRFRLASPEVLIDLNRIRDLAFLEERDGYLAIGAMTREHALEAAPVVAAAYPLLFDTAKVIADPLVRNKATVGGNLAHADPANDHPATMLAYDAQIIARSASGTRTIAIDDLFVGLFETSLAPGEILTEIRVPRPGPGSGGAYLKLERKVGDYAVAAVAVQLTLTAGTIERIRIGLTNVSPIPMRARAAEATLLGVPLSDGVLEQAARAAAAECAPSADLRGQVDYKRDMVRVLTKRTVRRAVERAQGARP